MLYEVITLRATWQATNSTTMISTASLGGATVRRFSAPGVGEALNLMHDRSLEVVLNHEGSGWQVISGISLSRNRLIV